MQPTENFDTPRRALDVEDYIDILRRHKGWIFGPFLLTLTASVVGIYLWPDSYQSVAAVQVRPQQVPESLVKSAVNQDMTTRINSLQNSILSRTTLTSIIRNHDLYKREMATRPPEEVVEDMRRQIQIVPYTSASTNKTGAFQVRFSYSNRRDAQQVVQELVSKFMDQNTRDRGQETHNTQTFVQDQTDLAQKELDAVEQRLTEFRLKNSGRLPDQLESNLRSLQALQASSQSQSYALSKLSTDKIGYETELRIRREKIAALNREMQTVSAAVVTPKSNKLASAERDVDTLQEQLTIMLQTMTESHPNVKTVRSYLATAIAKRDKIAQDEEQSARNAPPAAPVLNLTAEREIRDLNADIQRIESLVDATEKQQADLSRQVKQTNDQIASYNNRIQSVPIGDQEYGQLIRDQMIAKENFIKWKEKLNTATGAADMESRQQGEILELLDAASLPERATDPNRGMVISIGAGLGLLLGVVIAGAREMKDTSLKNLKDVRAYTQMAILGSVPLLENDFVVRRRKRMAWLGWTTACLFAAILMGGSIVYYYAVTRAL